MVDILDGVDIAQHARPGGSGMLFRADRTQTPSCTILGRNQRNLRPLSGLSVFIYVGDLEELFLARAMYGTGGLFYFSTEQLLADSCRLRSTWPVSYNRVCTSNRRQCLGWQELSRAARIRRQVDWIDSDLWIFRLAVGRELISDVKELAEGQALAGQKVCHLSAKI